MCFIRILRKRVKNKLTNRVLQYFLIQRVGRLLVFLRLIIEIWNPGKLFLLIFFRRLILKLGRAPFHWWYLKLIQNISWNMVWLLSIWQKIIPFIILTLRNFESAILIGVRNALLGRVGRFKQHNLKKILGLSSIFSMGWIFASLKINIVIWLKFIFVYGVILIYIVKLVVAREIYTCNRISTPINSFITFFFILGLFILRGFPPFVGFFLKLFILKTLIRGYFIRRLLLLIRSVLLVFSYLIMGFFSLTVSLSKNLVRHNKKLENFSFWEFLRFNSIGRIIAINVISF